LTNREPPNEDGTLDLSASISAPRSASSPSGRLAQGAWLVKHLAGLIYLGNCRPI